MRGRTGGCTVARGGGGGGSGGRGRSWRLGGGACTHVCSGQGQRLGVAQGHSQRSSPSRRSPSRKRLLASATVWWSVMTSGRGRTEEKERGCTRHSVLPCRDGECAQSALTRGFKDTRCFRPLTPTLTLQEMPAEDEESYDGAGDSAGSGQPRGGTVMKKLRIVISGFGAARQKMALE